MDSDNDLEEFYDDDGYSEYLDRLCFETTDFSEENISEILFTSGLISEKVPKYSGNMEKLIFGYGNDEEVYSNSEIDFIEKMQHVYLYQEFSKKLGYGQNMTCRVIATSINCKYQDAPIACMCFEKIINKALDGFNIFFFNMGTSVFLGCQIIDSPNRCDSILSYPIMSEYKFEQILEELPSWDDDDYFPNYYLDLLYVISSEFYNGENLDENAVLRKGINESYLDHMGYLEKKFGVNLSNEINRYLNIFEDNKEIPFESLMEEAEERLSFIKSKRINTYELLVEAKEMALRSEEVEEKNRYISQETEKEQIDADIELNEEIESLLEDPEETIKELKKRSKI